MTNNSLHLVTWPSIFFCVWYLNCSQTGYYQQNEHFFVQTDLRNKGPIDDNKNIHFVTRLSIYT